jgi:hypothetical protein
MSIKAPPPASAAAARQEPSWPGSKEIAVEVTAATDIPSPISPDARTSLSRRTMGAGRGCLGHYHTALRACGCRQRRAISQLAVLLVVFPEFACVGHSQFNVAASAANICLN